MKTAAQKQAIPPTSSGELPLFPDFPVDHPKKIRTYKRINDPIWTENKARFVQAYLKYFVQITKHGAYIDGFAGPQYHDQRDSWAAALVLDSKPKWLRQFFLFELSRRGNTALNELVEQQPAPVDSKGRKLPRTVRVIPGDFNANLQTILAEKVINQKEATFCLLDQRTFECHWKSLLALQAYKKPPNNKIELLYFLGVGWIHRAIKANKRPDILTNWWGNPEWKPLVNQNCLQLAETFRSRFQKELGYRHSAAYPIFDRNKGGRVMYYMVHASDHDEAPALMVRAHGKAVRAIPPDLQREFTGW